MAAISSGLLMFRRKPSLQFFLIHPGGPFYRNKNHGVWSIPKGLCDENCNLLHNAIREFTEETGIIPEGPFFPLSPAKMRSGKTIYAWAFEGEWHEDTGIVSNTFKLEWPPKSGVMIDFPEADRAMWASFDEACMLIHSSQTVFLAELRTMLALRSDRSDHVA